MVPVLLNAQIMADLAAWSLAHDPYPLPPNPTDNDRLYRELMIAKFGLGDPFNNFTRQKLREKGFTRQLFPTLALYPASHWLAMGIPEDQLVASAIDLAIRDSATGTAVYYSWKHDTGRDLADYYRRWFNDYFDGMMLLLRRMTKSQWKRHYGRARKKARMRTKNASAGRDAHNRIVQAATMRIVGQIWTLAHPEA